MVEELKINRTVSKEEQYQQLISQLNSLISGEQDALANTANICAALHESFGFLWTGLYRVREEELVLGPFQGPVACTRIQRGKGVCGTAWVQNKTIIVKNVDDFPGHIACSSLSRSEIVVPLHGKDGQVSGVLDIDSVSIGTFDDIDSKYLNKIVALLEPFSGL